MLVSTFIDQSKNAPSGRAIGHFDGKPISRQRGMIYWYRWGRHTFDIRVMREMLGLPVENEADQWFMPDNPYQGKSEEALIVILGELYQAMGDRSFKSLMKAHDDRAASAPEIPF